MPPATLYPFIKSNYHHAAFDVQEHAAGTQKHRHDARIMLQHGLLWIELGYFS